jgi:hypothetical protein
MDGGHEKKLETLVHSNESKPSQNLLNCFANVLGRESKKGTTFL